MCLCELVRPIPNNVGVYVLQHPRERRHRLGTARLLRLGLARVRVEVAELSGPTATVAAPTLPSATGLLYPSADAQSLNALAPEEHPCNLVVIDGTWSQAKKLYRDNDWLSRLPSYCLTPTSSRYRIRRQPRFGCLSTLESVVAALRCLEPELAGLDTLEDAFEAMIDAQLAASRGTNRSEGDRDDSEGSGRCRASVEPSSRT